MTETVLDPATPETPTATTATEPATSPESETPDTPAAEPATSPDGGDTPTADAPKQEATATDDLSDLTEISKEDRVKYAEQLKKLDPASRKTFNTLLTQKSQAAAAAAKAAESTSAKAKEDAARLEKAQQFLARLDSDPDAALADVQSTLEKRKKATEKPKEEKPALDPAFIAEVASHLDDSAKPLAPVLAPVLKGILEKELQPLRAHVEGEQTRAAAAAAEKVLTEFSTAHPDYKEHEPKILELGKKLGRGNMDDREFLETLYVLATNDTRAKAATDAVTAAEKKRAEDVIAKASKAATAAEIETPSVASTRVKYTKEGAPTVREAYEMAKRGEHVEMD